MEGLVLARLIHVVAVVVWIGGVAMVTLVVLPAARAARDPALFERVEHRFAERLRRDPDGALARMVRHHRLVLLLSLVTVAGAVAGSHGGW